MVAAEQHELEALNVGLVYVSEQVPIESTAVEVRERDKKETGDVEMASADGEESSKKPEFMTHCA